MSTTIDIPSEVTPLTRAESRLPVTKNYACINSGGTLVRSHGGDRLPKVAHANPPSPHIRIPRKVVEMRHEDEGAGRGHFKERSIRKAPRPVNFLARRNLDFKYSFNLDR